MGRLRYAKPVPIEESNDTFVAADYGFRCPGKQLLSAPGIPQQSEDCLTLNVFRQSNNTSKQPVMVYIHGGAFNRGYSSMHDTASMLSWSTKPFVAVSFNYRLSSLGFLGGSLAAREGALNLGLRDQTLVLEWVADNIEAFGGDPRDVTVVGLSAGAHSIGHHIMNINERRELFHKAVIESGGSTSRVVHPPISKVHEAQFQQLVGRVGCGSEPEDRVMQCLREADSESVIQAQISVFDEYNESLRWAWQPTIDGDIISRRPLDAWKSVEWHSVPVLTGFNHNEGTMYVPKKVDQSEQFVGFFHLPTWQSHGLSELFSYYKR